MATAKWIGASANVRQKDLITLAGSGDWVSGDSVTFTIANVSATITLGASSLFTDAQVATTIQQAWEGTTLTDTSATLTGFSIADGGIKAIPQFSELTATVSSNVVSLLSNGTGALAGKPWVLTVSESVTGDEAATESTSVTAISQYHANQADNWDGNSVPGNGDTVIFDAGSVDCRYQLDLGAIAVAQFTKYKAYSGNIGLARTNTDNSSKPYSEYRTPRYLTADGFTKADLEVGEGPGSGRIYLDGGTVQSAYNIFGKGTRIESGVPCVLLIGNHNSNVVRNLAGDVGLAFWGGETFTCATLISGDGPTSQAQTWCGPGCTLATVQVAGGTMATNSAVTTATQYAGFWDHYAGTVTDLTLEGGTFRPRNACTITDATIRGKLDLSLCSGTVTFTNLVLVDAGAEINDPNGRAAFSSGYKLNCPPSKVKITRPSGDTVTYS